MYISSQEVGLNVIYVVNVRETTLCVDGLVATSIKIQQLSSVSNRGGVCLLDIFTIFFLSFFITQFELSFKS